MADDDQDMEMWDDAEFPIVSGYKLEKEATEGCCPACQTPYDKDRVAGLENKIQRLREDATKLILLMSSSVGLLDKHVPFEPKAILKLPQSSNLENTTEKMTTQDYYTPDQSCSDEDVLDKIVSKPLCEEEIIPMKIDQYLDNAESDLMESLHEFAGELTLLKSIPPRIDETDCNFEEDIRLIEKLLYDNSSPRPPKEFVYANSDAKIKSFSPSPILVKDSDSLTEEIDLFCTLDYPMPLGIEDEDYDSERDILILRTCLDIIPFHLLKKSHSILIFLRFLVLLQNHHMVIHEF
uniref:Uncharacterized protein n=1 Tax=Tanacetum cinerariifolium TaxID=118510 RepID=A0A6L2JPU4_TANCI|nr:hypothetical protein [Tanacetum cinerariifolium]